MLSMAFTFISLLAFAQTKTDSIKVWGNCDMCKMKIEKAAKAAGAATAYWNDETKMLAVSYDASKTSNMDIQKKIASVGYDTQDVKATESAYKKLDKCCQYERPDHNHDHDSTSMKMDNGDTMNCCKKDDASCCKDKDAKCCKKS